MAYSSAYKLLCMGLYNIVFLTYGIEVSIIGPTIEGLAQQTGSTKEDVGVLFTIGGLSSLAGALPASWLVDMFPGHAVLTTCLVTQAIAMALMPFCTSLVTLSLVYAVATFTFYFVSAVGNSYPSIIYPHNFGTCINLINTVFGAGSFLAPVAAQLAYNMIGKVQGAYWAISAAILFVAFLTLGVPSPERQPPPGSPQESEDSPPPVSRGRSSVLSVTELDPEAWAAVQASAAAAAEASAAAAVAVDPESAASAAPAAKPGIPALDWLVLVPSAIMIAFCVGNEMSYAGWVFSYAKEQVGMDSSEATIVNSAFWLAFTLTRMLSTILSAMLPPSALLGMTLPFGVIAAFIPLIATPEFLAGGGLLACSIMMGVGNAAGFANTIGLMGRFIPITGATTATCGAAGGLGSMTLPTLVALLAKSTPLHFQALNVVLVVAYAIQLLLVLVINLMGARVKAQRAADAEGLKAPLLGKDVTEESEE